MRISLIGAGRVAYHLAKALVPQHDLVNIYSRSWSKAEHLAQRVSATAVQDLKQLDTDIDLVFIAVSDQSIAGVIAALTQHMPNVLIVHTSGSTSLSVLTAHHARSGVFYPLQTFSLAREIQWLATPIFIEAVESTDLQQLQTLAHSLSQRVYCYSSEQRLSLHLAAVFACNFSNYCYDMAKQVVDAAQVDFTLLQPLMLETVQKAIQNEPKQMQTGPAMRQDQNILQLHQQLLMQSQRGDLAEIYALMSRQIAQRHGENES